MNFKVPPNLFALFCLAGAKSCNERKGMQDFVTISDIFTGETKYTSDEIQALVARHLIDLGMAAIFGKGEDRGKLSTMSGVIEQGEKEPVADGGIYQPITPKAHFEYYKDNLLKVQLLPEGIDPKHYRIRITTIARVVLDKKD